MNSKSTLKEKLLPLILTLIAIITDQISKAIVVAKIPVFNPFNAENCIVKVIGNFFRFIHVKNNAIAFSLGSTWPDSVRRAIFAWGTLVLLILVFVYYFKTTELNKLQRWALCGILGGGIGNLIDRFFRPDGVVDFLDVYFGGFLGFERWPTFNIADSFVVVCGIIFVIALIVDRRKEKNEQ